MSRLKPINRSPKNQKVFHNMAFAIFCPKHRKIAVSDNYDAQKELAIWLPFVYLSSDTKKRLTVEESISLILSDGKPELMAAYKKEQPFDSNGSFVYCIKMKEFNFGFTRLVCLVRLHSDNPVLQCCRKTSRIIWLDIEHIFTNKMVGLWGPQIKFYAEQIDVDFQTVRHDYNNISSLFLQDPLAGSDQEILKSLNISEKQMQLFYMDFIDQCFPISCICFASFKEYLGKYGFKKTEKSMKRLFNAFLKYEISIDDEENCLAFEEILLGLALIDPQCVSNYSRLKFIFRYYDFDRDGYLSKEELREMIEDIHENEASDMIDILVADYWFLMSPLDKGVDFEMFWQSLRDHTLIIPNTLCRHEFRVLLKIISTLEEKNEGKVSRIKTFVSHYYRKILKKN